MIFPVASLSSVDKLTGRGLCVWVECLKAEGIESVMIEGGASIITACLQESAQAHLVDRVIVTVAPTFVRQATHDLQWLQW